MNAPIRVLVVDDSLFMRQMISDALNKEKDMTVVGAVSGGTQAIQMVLTHKPDVVTLDYEMPGLNGIAVLKRIMRHQPTAVVLVSSYAKKAANVTLDALREGAVDYVLKPSSAVDLNIDSFKQEMMQRVRTAAQVNIQALMKIRDQQITTLELRGESIQSNNAVVIGSSTGGTQVVEAILSALPKNFPCPIFVVQHMSGFFTPMFANRINQTSQLFVKEAMDGEIVEPGVAYIAPGDVNMELDSDDAKDPHSAHVRVKLSEHCDPLSFCPSIDVLMHCVAKLYGKRAIGVILSGMGSDGMKGSNEIALVGGYMLAQDKATSAIFGMGKSAIDQGNIDEVLPAGEIPQSILQRVSHV
jgi:two-component system, chemotaxis family, protein-glutamate methylesterase/glutaminase